MATASSATRANPARNRNVSTNVLSAIPMTDQTDPRKFPAYEFQEFPKMMLQPGGKPFLDDATGEPIVVLDADEEGTFRSDNPEALDVSSVGASALNMAERNELDQLRKASADSAGKLEQGNKLSGVTQRGLAAPARRPLTGKNNKPLPKGLD